MRWINRGVPILLLSVWGILYLPRPFTLGFYHDDWWTIVETAQGISPFSPERFKAFVGTRTAYAARPMAGVIVFLASSISGTSAAGFQILSILLALGAALSLWGWLRALGATIGLRSSLPADLAAAFWLGAPWAVAATAWPICALAALPAQIFFTESARILTVSGSLSTRRILFAASLQLASFLTYEAFYLQALIPAACLLLIHRPRLRWLLPLGAALLTAQLAAIGWNRYILAQNPSASKRLAANWPEVFQANVRGVADELSKTLRDHQVWWMTLAAVVAITALGALVMNLIVPSGRRLAAKVGALLALCAIGVLLACVVYALAGYAFSATEAQGRALFGVSWIVALLFFAIALAVTLSPFALRVAGWAAGISVLVISCMVQKDHLADWARVWQIEREVLDRVPVAAIRALSPEARVLFIGPAYHAGLIVFGADWDITGAVHAQPGFPAGRKAFTDLRRIHSAAIYNWTWDGETLTQELPQHFTTTFPCELLLVWDYYGDRVYLAQPGYQWRASS